MNSFQGLRVCQVQYCLGRTKAKFLVLVAGQTGRIGPFLGSRLNRRSKYLGFRFFPHFSKFWTRIGEILCQISEQPLCHLLWEVSQLCSKELMYSTFLSSQILSLPLFKAWAEKIKFTFMVQRYSFCTQEWIHYIIYPFVDSKCRRKTDRER